MTRHSLIKLGVGTALAVLLALWATSTRSPEQGIAARGAPLVAGLRDALNEVKQLRIIEAGDKAVVTLNRGANGWTVAERGDYAADIAKVREFLIKLAEAKLGESKTANPERHAVLGVEDIGKADAKGMRVELDGKINAKLIVGNYSSQSTGTFVRRNDEPQSWLVSGNLVPDRVVANWLNKTLIDVPSDRIMQVEITRDGKSFSVSKTSPEQPNFVLDNIPTGRELVSEYEGNGIASVLGALSFDDVMKTASAVPDPASMIVARYRTFDGLIVNATGFASEGKNYVSFKASVDPDRADIAAKAAQLNAVADHKKDQDDAVAEVPKGAAAAPGAAVVDVPKAVSDPAAFVAERRKAIDDEAAQLNARVNGWVYVLPAFKYANINKRLEDLLKPKG